MNQRDEMHQRISEIRKAYREGRDPPITTTALRIICQATGADVARLYQLAESIVFEVYWSGASEHDAAIEEASVWRARQQLMIETTGAPCIPLAETGGYMRLEKTAEDIRRLAREANCHAAPRPILILQDTRPAQQ